jgi:arginine-tRNA-protein transferase
VYCYYDPAFEKRSLGMFNILWSLAYARRENIPWYYLGYYIAGCKKMNYKIKIQPCEVLEPDGTWRIAKPETSTQSSASID